MKEGRNCVQENCMQCRKKNQTNSACTSLTCWKSKHHKNNDVMSKDITKTCKYNFDPLKDTFWIA